jgi:hypothetical protein
VSDSLTDRWIGRYTYAGRRAAPVPFEVDLIQLGEMLDGHVTEPNTFHAKGEAELIAQLTGTVIDGAVDFVKRYVDLPAEEHPRYDGRVLPSGDRIEGTWHFPKARWFTGEFVMIRKPRASARVQRKAAASLEV